MGEIAKAGYTIKEMAAAGFTLNEYAPYFDVKLLLAEGFSEDQIRKVKCDACVLC